MKRVWKYVHRVEKHLPLARRIPIGGAIFAELREQVRAREAELGRELSEAEIDRITSSYGDPRQVAERHIACDPGARPLVDRYLGAVGRHLPQDKAHDILAEMREAIESAIEGREEAAGAPLDDEDVGEILKEFSPPMVAANRYAKRNYLIGPDLYPFFWPTAKAVVGVVAAAAIFFAFILAITSGNWARFPAKAIDGFLEFFLPAFAVMILVFMFLDRSNAGAKIAEAWNPRSLPHDAYRKPKTMFESVLGLGFDLLFILWWTKAVDFSGFGGAEASVALNWDGGWARYHTVILVLASCSAFAHSYDIFHPGWSRARAVFGMSAHAVGVYVASQLARQPSLAVEGPGASDLPERTANMLHWVNLNLQLVLGLVAVLMAISIIVEGWRLVRSLSELAPRTAERA